MSTRHDCALRNANSTRMRAALRGACVQCVRICGRYTPPKTTQRTPHKCAPPLPPALQCVSVRVAHTCRVPRCVHVRVQPVHKHTRSRTCPRPPRRRVLPNTWLHLVSHIQIKSVPQFDIARMRTAVAIARVSSPPRELSPLFRLAIGDWRLAIADCRLPGDWRLAIGDCPCFFFPSVARIIHL